MNAEAAEQKELQITEGFKSLSLWSAFFFLFFFFLGWISRLLCDRGRIFAFFLLAQMGFVAIICNAHPSV